MRSSARCEEAPNVERVRAYLKPKIKRRSSTSHGLARPRCRPSLVGTADRTTPPSHSCRMADGIPFAHLVMMADAGHALNREAPDELAGVIESLTA